MQLKKQKLEREYKQTSRTPHHIPFSATLQERYNLGFRLWKMPVMK